MLHEKLRACKDVESAVIGLGVSSMIGHYLMYYADKKADNEIPLSSKEFFYSSQLYSKLKDTESGRKTLREGISEAEKTNWEEVLKSAKEFDIKKN